MNTAPSTDYSLEQIKAMRIAKRREIQQSVRKIQLIGEQLFAPQKSIGKMDGIMQQVNAGIAAYDGIMTGLKIIRRIQSFFHRRRRR